MSRNKEEATKARIMAERKMQEKDFIGARKIALKAQQLFPDLENIIQILTVCEVHCCVENKVTGLDDWYGILQIVPTADALSIKRQCWKLLYLLHPDRNKFAGAEDAFKLVEEAYAVLSNQVQRLEYHIKLRDSFGISTQEKTLFHPNGNINVVADPKIPITTSKIEDQSPCSTGLNQQHEKQVHVGPSHSFGRIIFQCPWPVKNKNLYYQCGLGKEKSQMERESGHKLMFEEVDKRECAIKYSQAPKWRRTRQTILRCMDTGSTQSEEVITVEGSGCHGVNGNNNSSTNSDIPAKQKQNNTSIQDMNDEDCSVNPPKRLRTDSSSRDVDHNDAVLCNSIQLGGKDGDAKGNYIWQGKSLRHKNGPAGNHNKTYITQKWEAQRDKISEGGTSSIDSGVNLLNSEYLSCPECSNFDNDKGASSFEADQIWALYDDFSGMPRFYAKIRYVSSPGLKVFFTWLDHVSVDQTEMDWSDNEMPIACGNFKLGRTQYTEDLHVFSHQITWEKGVRKNSYLIRPKKGEVWALYKDWDIRWSTDLENNKSFEYEIMEVLSDYTERDNCRVVSLTKVNGFASLFVRVVSGFVVIEIPSKEILRFSHLVCCRISAVMTEGIPYAFYDLDPASLPPNVVGECPHSRRGHILEQSKTNILRNQNIRSGNAGREHILETDEKRSTPMRDSCSNSKPKVKSTSHVYNNNKFSNKVKKRSKSNIRRNQNIRSGNAGRGHILETDEKRSTPIGDSCSNSKPKVKSTSHVYNDNKFSNKVKKQSKNTILRNQNIRSGNAGRGHILETDEKRSTPVRDSCSNSTPKVTATSHAYNNNKFSNKVKKQSENNIFRDQNIRSGNAFRKDGKNKPRSLSLQVHTEKKAFDGISIPKFPEKENNRDIPCNAKGTNVEYQTASPLASTKTTGRYHDVDFNKFFSRKYERRCQRRRL